MSLRGYTCWTREDALRVLPIEALQGDDAIFLATHLSIENFSVGGAEAGLVRTKSEAGLLEAFTDTGARHVFCVIEGEPGSGKSHLIRWLHIKWPRGERSLDRVVLIQRADGSLEGTLRQLRDQIPEEHRELFEGLGPAQGVADEGRRRNFHTKLANAMERGHFVESLPDEEWCAKNNLAQILHSPAVKEHWSAPHHILELISGKGESGGRKNSELADFKLRHVAEIGQLRSAIGHSIGGRGIMLVRKLQKEAKHIQSALADGKTEAEMRESLEGACPNSIQVLAALNHRRDHAIQELLGPSAGKLTELFRELRRKLAKKNERLVLLLEDITNFQGVDKKLVDALVERSDTDVSGTLGDMVAIVGITPDYYSKYLKANYQQRITQHVLLGAENETSRFQEVLQFNDQGAPVRFAARYLRAVRAGADKLKGYDGSRPVFNQCAQCPHRAPCHQSFGAVGGVGLYPLTAQAIRQIFDSLRDPDNAMTQRTPRGLIQNVLNPTLHTPDRLADGAYPHAGIETKYLPEPLRTLRNPLQKVVSTSEQEDRLTRLFAWWGTSRSSTAQDWDERGNPTFAGVPRSVFEVLGLPWLGGQAESRPPEVDITTPEADSPAPGSKPDLGQDDTSPKPESDQPSKSKSNPSSGGSSSSGTTSTGKGTGRTGGGGKKVFRHPELEKRRNQLRAWANQGHTLKDGTFWNGQLHKLLDREVRWQHLGISPWLQTTLFSEHRVLIEGTQKVRAGHFVTRRDELLVDGLEAYIVLNTRPLPDEDLEFHRYYLLRLVRRLEKRVQQHIKKQLEPVEEQSWSPVALMVQVFLVRAWLQGHLHPQQPLHEQWAALFEDENPQTVSAPKSRYANWGRLSGVRMGSLPGELVKRLPLMVSLPQGGTPGNLKEAFQGLADPADAIQAALSLRDNMAFSPYPLSQKLRQRQLDFLLVGLELVEKLESFSTLPKQEGQRLLDLCQRLSADQEYDATTEYIRRVNTTLQRLDALIPHAPKDPLVQWSRLHKRSEQSGLLSKTAESKLDALEAFRVDAQTRKLESFSTDSALMSWCIQAPAGEIQQARELVEQAHSSLDSLMDYVEGLMEETAAAGTTTLKDLHDAGDAMSASCSNIITTLKSED